ncbi:MAG: two-component system LytT family response regulator [Salibacteraceae bacterium]|jgi:two-component system LytT family response regulator
MEYILIVEDDINIRESLQEIFELSGYEVSTAQNGKLGYDSIMENCPDLVICDVDMPELDGFELLQAINQRLKNAIIPPFLFLTAKVEAKDLRQGMNLGADDYIFKPFDHKDILRSVRLRLDKRSKLMQNGNMKQISVNNAAFDKLALPCDEGLILVSFDEIIKCQADRAYCSFHLTNGQSILVSKSMKEFEQLLLDNNFIKVHKSTIVNINYAKKYLRGKGGQLIMSDASIVYVSVRKKEELMKVLRHKSNHGDQLIN